MHDEKSKLKALSDIASIDITLEFDEILKNVLKLTCDTLKALSGTIMLVDEVSGEFRIVASFGLPDDCHWMLHETARKAGVKLTSGFSGTVMETGKYYIVPDVSKDPKVKPWYDISREFGFSSIIFNPMKQGMKVIGLLNIYWANPHQFTDDEINFSAIAASHATSVVLNARMYGRLQDNTRELNGYRELFENADDPMYTLDTEGRFQTINNAGLKVLGVTREEITGSHISGWLAPDSFKLSMEVLKKQISGEPLEKPIEIEVITKNGEHVWGEITTRVIKEGGKITGIHGIARDITEKRRLEQVLKESEEIYRDLFENADDPMFTLDTEEYFLALNKAGLKLLGCTKDELLGTHVSGWMTPESYIIAREGIKKRLLEETPEPPTILELIAKNGEHVWVEVRSRILKYGDRITGIHGIARNITEKRRLEQNLKEIHRKLEESEARYKDLFENAADPMYTLDAGWNFREINNAGLRVLGCKREDIIGSHISRWLTQESMKAADDRLKRIALGLPVPETIVYELVCKNGEHRWAEIRNRPIMDAGRVTGFQGNARDVTEKRRLELQIKEYHEKLQKSYQELVEADRIKTEFVSNITHELLTPMTSIKGFTELLYDETTGKINSEQKKSIEIIIRNSERLIRLIKDLLDVANLEKKNFGMKFEMILMNDIILKTIQDNAPFAKEKHITIIQNLAPLPRIWGDSERLTQVITNLLTNAIKFTPQNGTITVTTCENQKDIKISVTDTGIGIPADKLTRIFDRFYQIDGSDRRKYGGIGLGLSICKSIIESHYGSIQAQSDGKGSTFHITLPKLMDTKKIKKGHESGS